MPEPIEGNTHHFRLHSQGQEAGRREKGMLLSLLTAMAPAAVQGAWSAVIREPVEQETYLDMAFGRVKNTCWVWREDGPLIAKYKSMTETTGT